MTQKQLVQTRGMSQAEHFKHEAGEKDIPLQVLMKLTDFQASADDPITAAASPDFCIPFGGTK